MSWDSYVEEQLVATGNIAKGEILGLDGSHWGGKAEWRLSEKEAKAIAAFFQGNNHTKASEGIHVWGEKHIGIFNNEQSIYGKNKANGVVIVKTKKAILVGYYKEPTQPGVAVNTVERLGDYLRDQDY